ncbi:MAG: PH domain-containing protein [bacterium]
MIDTGDESAPPIFRIVGLLFIVFGCYHLFGRFFINALVRARTYYTLTSERVVISTGIFSRNLQSINLRALTEMELSEHSGGRGTITLGQRTRFNRSIKVAGFPVCASFSPCLSRSKTPEQSTRKSEPRRTRHEVYRSSIFAHTPISLTRAYFRLS